MNIPIEEIRADLANTESDIIALSNIVGGLDIFMTRTGGEDRHYFKVDRLKYSSLLSQAHQLKQKIQSALDNALRVSSSTPELTPES